MQTGLEIALAFWATLSEMAPYLLFGFLVAGALSVLLSPATVERHLGGRGVWPVLKASLFGVPLPLCSCGVIPVAASLRRHGASKGATTAFLLSTPQTGVDSVLVTFSLLGPLFAVFRPFAALITGLLGGAITEIAAGTDRPDAAPPCRDACCASSASRGGWFRALHYGFVTLPQDIGRALLLGLVVAGVIAVFVPGNFFAETLGTGLLPMIVMMLMGIPVYVCATASVPIAAAMMAKGISPGAALVFLMTGPATNAAAIATIWRLLGRRCALVYLGVVAASALAAGLVLDYLFVSAHIPATHHAHGMLPQLVKTVSAIALLLILGAGALNRHRSHAAQTPEPQDAAMPRHTTRLRVRGMTCSHCEAAVRRALLECDGVESANVSRESGTALVSGRDYDVAQLCETIEELGYRAASDGVEP